MALAFSSGTQQGTIPMPFNLGYRPNIKNKT